MNDKLDLTQPLQEEMLPENQKKKADEADKSPQKTPEAGALRQSVADRKAFQWKL